MDNPLRRAAIVSGSLISLLFLVALANARREGAADTTPQHPVSAAHFSR